MPSPVAGVGHAKKGARGVGFSAQPVPSSYVKHTPFHPPFPPRAPPAARSPAHPMPQLPASTPTRPIPQPRPTLLSADGATPPLTVVPIEEERVQRNVQRLAHRRHARPCCLRVAPPAHVVIHRPAHGGRPAAGHNL
eukprot:scaffold8494_cov125-Isochrysis_galbana.AAC.7